MKINRIWTSMITTLLFSLKKSITAISFYWRNDTPTFLSPDRVHSQISSPLRLSVLCLVRSDFFVILHSESVPRVGTKANTNSYAEERIEN